MEAIAIIIIACQTITVFTYINLYKQQKQFTEYWYKEHAEIMKLYFEAVKALIQEDKSEEPPK
jgi:cephalosporin-C deacetylase-like acetyl esterase